MNEQNQSNYGGFAVLEGPKTCPTTKKTYVY